MRPNKNTSKIILAAVVAILATMISYAGFNNMNKQLNEQHKLITLMQKTKSSFSNYKNSYTYAVATKNLKIGEIVANQDIDFKKFEKENKEAFENRSDVINKILLENIADGAVFTTAHIAKISAGELVLKDGYRALTLPANNFQGRSDSMTPGSFVDVYSASADNQWALEGIKILSTEGGNLAVAGKPPSVTNAAAITFEVPSEYISDFISNISKGKLVLVSRGAGSKVITREKSKALSSGSSNLDSMSSLPNLPSSGSLGNISGLPEPIQPATQSPSVEVIEANVKSKVTFD